MSGDMVSGSVKAILASVSPGTAVVVELIGKALNVRKAATELRLQTWADYYMHRANDEDFDRELEYEDLDDAKSRVVIESVRAAIEPPDPAAVPALARLARLYVTTEVGKHDRFFRAITRMLVDATAAELDELRALLVWVLNATQRTSVLVTQRGAELHVVLDEFAVTEHQESENDGKRDLIARHALDARRAIRMLTASDVFEPSGAMYVGGAPPNARFLRKHAEILRYALTGTRPWHGA